MENTFEKFPEEVAVALIATLIMAVLTFLYKRYKDSFIRLFQSVFLFKKIGIKRIVKTRTKAVNLIWQDLLESTNIKVLNYKGYSFLHVKNFSDTILNKIRKESNRLTSADFLLLNPEATSIIKARRDDLPSLEGYDDSSDDIKQTIKLLYNLDKDKNMRLCCNCRLFEEKLKWSLILSSSYILVSFYTKDITALNSTCLVLFRKSILGESFEKYFDELLEKSKDGYKYIESINLI